MLTLGLIGSLWVSTESFLLAFISAIPFLGSMALLGGTQGGYYPYPS
jgi:hypothetical protein